MKQRLIYPFFCLILTWAGAFTHASVTLDHMIGQMVMMGFGGDDVRFNSKVGIEIGQEDLGGIILFNKLGNIKDVDQVMQLISNAQRLAEVPLFVAIDQEGGMVQRLRHRHGFDHELPSAQQLAQEEDAHCVEDRVAAMARELSSIGFNVDFSPCIDLAVDPENTVIVTRGRSFGEDVATVVEYGGAFVDGLRNASIISSLKHFPGHGSSKGDTHEGFVDVTQVWTPQELEPFAELIAQDKADMVMIAHVYNSKWGTLPASLSPYVITTMLREQLGYEGVVITDDLDMRAIRWEYTFEQTIRYAIEAGVDILLVANTQVFFSRRLSDVKKIIKQMIAAGTITEERIRQSYQRIKTLKASYGLDQQFPYSYACSNQ